MRDNSDYTLIEQRRLYKSLGVRKRDVAKRCKCGAKSWVYRADGTCFVCAIREGKK